MAQREALAEAMAHTHKAEREALREQLAAAQRSMLAERAARQEAERKLKQLTEILANSGLGLGLGGSPSAANAGAAAPKREQSTGASSTARSSSCGSLSSFDGAADTSPPSAGGSSGAASSRSRGAGGGEPRGEAVDERAMAALFLATSAPGAVAAASATRGVRGTSIMASTTLPPAAGGRSRHRSGP